MRCADHLVHPVQAPVSGSEIEAPPEIGTVIWKDLSVRFPGVWRRWNRGDYKVAGSRDILLIPKHKLLTS